jgi:hypothetical protein
MPPTTLYGDGDAIKGDRIVCTYRSCSGETVINRTHRHKAGERTLTNAHCWIMTCFRYVKPENRQ